MRMKPYDMPIEELQQYQPPLTRESDFDAFWDSSLERLDGVPTDVLLTRVDYPASGIELFQLSYTSFADSRIFGYYGKPVGDGQFPGLVLYHGYNGSYDGGIHDVVNWALRGYATFGMLCRGQQTSEDKTGTPAESYAGWMTKGVLDKDEYYYRGVYLDAVRALDVLASLDEVDASRIGVTGASQGGGLSLVAAALSDIPKVAVATFPYLAHFRRAIDMAETGPYQEFNHFFRRNSNPDVEEQTLTTLSYFDVMNLAPKVKCEVLVCSGLVDEITPPSTIFAAYNHLSCEKEMAIYRYFGHEFISDFVLRGMSYLQARLQGE